MKQSLFYRNSPETIDETARRIADLLERDRVSSRRQLQVELFPNQPDVCRARWVAAALLRLLDKGYVAQLERRRYRLTDRGRDHLYLSESFDRIKEAGR